MTTEPSKSDALNLEELMESKDLPESDRDELRQFSEFLAIRKDRSKITPKMVEWLTGKDVKP